MPGVLIPLIIISTATMSVRAWARFSRQTGSFGIDDIFIFGAWVNNLRATRSPVAKAYFRGVQWPFLLVPSLVCHYPCVVLLAFVINGQIATESFGFDRHIWDVRPDLLAPGAKVRTARRAAKNSC